MIKKTKLAIKIKEYQKIQHHSRLLSISVKYRTLQVPNPIQTSKPNQILKSKMKKITQ